MIDKDFYIKKQKQKHNNNTNSNTKQTNTNIVYKGKNALYNHYIYTSPARIEILKK